MVEINQGSLSIDDQKQREGLGIGWEISTFGRQFQSNTVYSRPQMWAGLYFCVSGLPAGSRSQWAEAGQATPHLPTLVKYFFFFF